MPADAASLSHSFGALNYVVLIIYFLAMLAVGIWAGRSTKGAAGYFTGEGKVHHVLVGLSLLGTYLSSLTMMALPAVAYGPADWLWTVQLPFLLITAVVITRFVLPRYRQEGCISVYEFLERRIHVSSRLIAAVAFIVLSIGRMGLVLYLPALAFSKVTGFDLVTTIVAMGVVVAVYTVLGGIKGVIWTDAIQVVVFVVGAVASVFYFHPNSAFFAAANAAHKFRMFDGRLDATETVTAWLILETVFQTVRIYATQQEMTQRYLTAESTAKANRSVWISILGYIPLGYLFYFIGTGMYVFYQQHNDPGVALLASQGRLDSLYAYFVVTRMPQGLAGLVIAAFFAAAQSTIASSMNSCSAVCVEDFYRRFSRKARSDFHYLVVAKSLSVLWGTLAIAMAIVFMRIQSAQITWSKVMGISTCGILGLMALAFLPRRVNPWAALTGWGVSCLALVLMNFNLQVKPNVALVFPRPATFQSGDFKDPQLLALSLKEAREPVSQLVRGRLPAEARGTLDGLKSDGPIAGGLEPVLAGGLNRVLAGPSLYTPEAFANVTLSKETEDLAKGKPAGADLVRLNRLLLEDAYPAQIKPCLYPLRKGAGVSFLLWPVVTNLLCFGIAFFLNLLFPRKDAEKA